jgi:hypothetical protein
MHPKQKRQVVKNLAFLFGGGAAFMFVLPYINIYQKNSTSLTLATALNKFKKKKRFFLFF